MTNVVPVASAVFRESVRDRVPLSIVLFAVLLIGASFFISQLTAGQDMKIIKDLGLAAIRALGVLIAVFIGIGLVAKEVERRSVYSLLSKPVSRAELVVAKFVGLLGTLGLNVAAMTMALYGLLFYMNAVALPGERASWPTPATDPRLLLAILLIFAELATVTAIALFFSTFSSPLLATLFTGGLWLGGHFVPDLRSVSTVVESPLFDATARGISYLLPNVQLFDVKSAVVHGLPVASAQVVAGLAYASLYALAFVLLAVVVFRRRDFK